MKEIFLLFLIMVFVIGLYLHSINFNLTQFNETYDPICPDMLIRKENKLYLFNKKTPYNNIMFNDINEYKKYLEMQKQNGKRCPMLYLQQENNAQGKDVFVMHTSHDEISNIIPTSIRNTENSLYGKVEQFENVIDAGRDNPPYNANNYPSFDPYGLYIGKHTNLDEIHYSTEKEAVSDNPMDTNWGGIKHTEQSINSGKYEENNVYKTTYYTPVNGIISPNSIKQMGNTFAESFKSFW